MAVRLVAVQHGEAGRLVGPHMAHLFVEEVIPHLTNETVMVVEGGKRRGQLLPTNPNYNIIYQQLGPVTSSGIRPILHSDDATYHLLTPREAMATHDQLDRYVAATKSFLSFRKLPNTWEEMVAMVRENNHAVVAMGKLPKKWKKYGREGERVWKARDALFAKQIMSYANQGRSVFFVGGLLHCITLTAQYGWPVLRYECSSKQIHAFYAFWYVKNKITQHIAS